MNTLKFIAAVLLISSLMVSCENATDSTSKEQTETALHETHSHDDNTETINLNNGDKWVVNEEMKPHIHEAKDILHQYTASKSEDYKTLAAKLKERNDSIIKSCTMEGESHDELHKWLHPHIELVASLSKAESTEEANEIIADIHTSFSTYDQYFQ
jgi:hypothetical protein